MDEVRRLGGDGGFALVETLVALALLGVAFVAILEGFRVAIVSSDAHRQQAEAETVVVSAAEYVKVATHMPCGTGDPTSGYEDEARRAAPTEDWEGSITIRAIHYWNGHDWVGQCPDDHTESLDYLSLQLVTIDVTSPGDRATESLSVLKGEDD